MTFWDPVVPVARPPVEGWQRYYTWCRSAVESSTISALSVLTEMRVGVEGPAAGHLRDRAPSTAKKTNIFVTFVIWREIR